MFATSFVPTRERELPSWLALSMLVLSTVLALSFVLALFFLLAASVDSKYLGSERSGAPSFPTREPLSLLALSLSLPARERGRVLVSWLAESLMVASAVLALFSLCKGRGIVFLFLLCFFCLALELFGILVLAG
jgi:hypothetical protein